MSETSRSTQHHVFLSYSRADTATMLRVHEDLSAAGFRVWTDKTGIPPGTPSWRTAIQAAIDSAGCIVVIFSPDSKQSKWVGEEIAYAEAQSLPIFPILVRGDAKTSAPFGYTSAQWVDIRQNYDTNIKELAATIRARLGIEDTPDIHSAGEPDQHTAPQVEKHHDVLIADLAVTSADEPVTALIDEAELTEHPRPENDFDTEPADEIDADTESESIDDPFDQPSQPSLWTRVLGKRLFRRAALIILILAVALGLIVGLISTVNPLVNRNILNGGLQIRLYFENKESVTSVKVESTRRIIEKRLQALGITSYLVQALSSNRILVEIPDMSDPKHVVDTIKQPGFLEFVDFSKTGCAGMKPDFPQVGEYILTDRQQKGGTNVTGTPLPGLSGSKAKPKINPCTNLPFVTLLTGDSLKNVSVGTNSTTDQSVVNFELAATGESNNFSTFVRNHIGEPIAIVLDGKILSAPAIQPTLATGGQISGIEGYPNNANAESLVVQLQTGSLPLSLLIESIDKIGS